MMPISLKSRESKCAGWWYPAGMTKHNIKDNPVASIVISPHAGFEFSGMVSLKAVSYVKKNRVWIFGTSHYEHIKNGISVFPGDYCSSIGQAVFPVNTEMAALRKYYSDAGHRTDEHSIENVLYSLNHFSSNVNALCVLVQVDKEKDFDRISGDIADVWMPGDSIIVSTDWNHFVPVIKIDRLMDEVFGFLTGGDIEGLYKKCTSGNLEACGIDGLYLAGKILARTGEPVKFNILDSTDSSSVSGRKPGEKCVGYIAAANCIN